MKQESDTQAVADQHTQAQHSHKRPRQAAAASQHQQSPAAQHDHNCTAAASVDQAPSSALQAPRVPSSSAAVTAAHDTPSQPLTVGQACSSSNRTVSAALRRWAQLRFPDAYRTAIGATPVATLLPHLGCYLQHLMDQTAAGVVKGEAAARSAQELHQWLTQQQQQQQLVGSGADYAQLLDQTQAAVLALQQLKQQPVVKLRPGAGSRPHAARRMSQQGQQPPKRNLHKDQTAAAKRKPREGQPAARRKAQKAAQPSPSAGETSTRKGDAAGQTAAVPPAAAVAVTEGAPAAAAAATGTVDGSARGQGCAAAAAGDTEGGAPPAAPPAAATAAVVDKSRQHCLQLADASFGTQLALSQKDHQHQQHQQHQQAAVGQQQCRQAATAAVSKTAPAGAWLGAGKICLSGSAVGRTAAAAAAARAGGAAPGAAAAAAAASQGMHMLAALSVASLPQELPLQAFCPLAQRSTACPSAAFIQAGTMQKAAAAACGATCGTADAVGYIANAGVAAVRSTAQSSVTWGKRRDRGGPANPNQPSAAASAAAGALGAAAVSRGPLHAATGPNMVYVPVIAVPSRSILGPSQLQLLAAQLPAPSVPTAPAAPAPAAAAAAGAAPAGAPLCSSEVQALYNAFATSLLQQAGMPLAPSKPGQTGSRILAKLQEGLAAGLGLAQQQPVAQHQQQQQPGLQGQVVQQHQYVPVVAPLLQTNQPHNRQLQSRSANQVGPVPLTQVGAPSEATASAPASPSEQHAGPTAAVAAAAVADVPMHAAAADMQQGRSHQQHQQLHGQEPSPAGTMLTSITAGRLAATPPNLHENTAEAAAVDDATAASPRGMPTTLADLQQLLPQHKGLDLLLAIAQQVHGPDADPATVEVGPLLLLWTDPETLQDCRDSFETAGHAQCSATLVLLEGLLELVSMPVVAGVLGEEEQQQQLMAVLGSLVHSCGAALQVCDAHCQQQQQQQLVSSKGNSSR